MSNHNSCCVDDRRARAEGKVDGLARHLVIALAAIFLTSAIIGSSVILPDTLSQPSHSLGANGYASMTSGLVYELA